MNLSGARTTVLTALVLALGVTTACAGMPRAPAGSCMQQTLDSLDLSGLTDVRMHCLVAGTIAIRCGPGSALLAGYGKEFADLFGAGTAERRDLRANRAGRQCAGTAPDEDALQECCAEAGY